MRQAPSFTSAFLLHFVRTCIDQPTAANPGQSCKPTDSPVAATRSGSPSTRRTVRDTAFNTSQTTALTVAAVACNSNARPTAESPGRPRLLFLTSQQPEHWTWTRMATFLLVAKDSAHFIAFVPATRSLAVRPQPLIRSHRSTWVASSVVSGESIQTDCGDSVFWRSTVRAPRLTTT